MEDTKRTLSFVMDPADSLNRINNHHKSMEKHQSFVAPHLRHSIFGFLSSPAILPRFFLVYYQFVLQDTQTSLRRTWYEDMDSTDRCCRMCCCLQKSTAQAHPHPNPVVGSFQAQSGQHVTSETLSYLILDLHNSSLP